MKRVDGVEKSLLRSAVADLLPDEVLHRRKSAYPTTQEAAYGDFVRQRFAELAADRDAAVAGLLDTTATAEAVAADGSPQGAFAWVERARHGDGAPARHLAHRLPGRPAALRPPEAGPGRFETALRTAHEGGSRTESARRAPCTAP